MKRRTEILIEFEREIIISTSRNNRSWCATCGKQLQMLKVGEAAQLMKTDESAVYRLAESGDLHFSTTSEGMLLICPESLVVLKRDEHQHAKQTLMIADGKV